MLEFLVDSVSDSGHAHGRNGDQDIPVGTTFTALRRSRVHRESGAYRSEDLGEAERISLTLREVHCYRRSLDAVPRGFSASLAVFGEGLPLLARSLDDLPSDEFLWLVAPPSAEKPSPASSACS